MTDWPEIFTKIALNRAIHPYQDLATAAATPPGPAGIGPCRQQQRAKQDRQGANVDRD